MVFCVVGVRCVAFGSHVASRDVLLRSVMGCYALLRRGCHAALGTSIGRVGLLRQVRGVFFLLFCCVG